MTEWRGTIRQRHGVELAIRAAAELLSEQPELEVDLGHRSIRR
jgi:hypothetical protein